MKYVAGLLFSLLLPIISLAEPVEQIRYFQTDARYNYRIELLQLVLDKTRDEFGSAVLQAETFNMSHGRGELSLENGLIDVAFFATNKTREQRFRAIKYPILQGILGYRILLVHKGRQADFAGIKSLEQLANDFIGGFGTHWADMAILEDNQLKIITNPLYPNLFAMLDANRFDYFPRGINEIWQEAKQLGESYRNIVIEQTLAFYYPYPVYFFVTRDNTRLAKRIRLGLEQALKDGSLKELFLKYHLQDIQRSRLHQRRILLLENNQLPLDSPKPDSQWWLKLVKNVR
ncbi:transporter substrate-binding domain-containing protein [Thalassomonas viridans]|uniref:Transporter substrate-binding domain-containing protein n=1 Tax=Thalassomonas viridans TaxID=137584 RepID=A0AAF0CCH9_9GAMM|nr:transporter substrate-binding domain-containing protein [Thalassomonas viridans]WDE07920.1 transporter substrate-binding domain-containing protein [Thalassomonas viridans]